MATVKLFSESITGPLWLTRTPSMHQNGLLLEVVQDSHIPGGGGSSNSSGMTGVVPRCNFTTFAFNPFDMTRCVFGDAVGTVYSIAMKKNRFSVVARLATGAPVTSLAYLSPETLIAASSMQVHMIDLDRCRVDQKVVKTPHQNHIHRTIIHPSRQNFAVTLSVDCIALWQTAPLKCTHNTREHAKVREGEQEVVVKFNGFTDAEFNDDGVLVSLEAKGFLTIWDTATSNGLTPLKRVDIAPHKPTSLAICSNFLVVGTKAARFLSFSLDLDGIDAVTIPGSSGIQDIRLIDSDVIVAQTMDGHVWFINSKDYAVSFSMSHPSIQPAKAFPVAGATYGAFVTPTKLYIYHLVAAKAHYDRTITGMAATGTSRTQTTVYPFLKGPKEAGGPRNGVSSVELNTSQAVTDTPLPRAPLAVEESTAQEWIKVNLVKSSEREVDGAMGFPETLLLTDAIRGMNNADNASAYKNRGASSARARATVESRSSTKTLTGTVSSNQKTMRSSSSIGGTRKTGFSGNDKENNFFNGSVSNAVSLRGMIDGDSKVVNMDKLRGMLVRYGSFPDRYRPLIWRFLLQLPEKRVCEPQFGRLVGRGPHPAVKTLMRPFPLPETKLRTLLFNALSALAWHSPVFSAVHFIPSMVFPFVKLYSSDMQSTIEVFLAFIINWGKEFFLYYPHPPVSITSFIYHTLKANDPALVQHFEEQGLGTDVYVWDVMSSLYSEIFTRNEWLQVMDHAFANEPIWLFLLHVQWLRQLRGPLIETKDHATLVAMLRRASPININQLIQSTYKLQAAYVQGDLSDPYRRFYEFKNDIYPPILECNESTITTKVRELESIQAHEAGVLNMRDRITHIRQQLLQAQMLEDAFIGKQKATVAAKFEVSNETWNQQVELEKERQRLRDIEHETRLHAIQEQLRSAQRVEALQAEINAASGNARDAEIDRQREIMKWNFADRMANQEIERLEAGARMKLTSIIQSATAIAEDSRSHQFHHNSTSALHTEGGYPKTPTNEEVGIVESHHHTPYTSWKVESSLPVADESEVNAQPAKTMRTPPRKPVISTQKQTSNFGMNESSTIHNVDVTKSTDTTNQKYKMQKSAAVTNASTATTSTPQSSCGSDPSEYFRNLQATVNQKIQSNQELHKTAVEGLKSKYAQFLMGQQHEDDNRSDLTSVTEPDVDSSSDAAADSPAPKSANHSSGHKCCNHPFEHKASPQKSQTSRVSYYQKNETSHAYSSNNQSRFVDPGVQASLNDSETETATSMAEAITRPHTRNYFR